MTWRPFIMPFGKYTGMALSCVPTAYLRWLESVGLFPEVVKPELATRGHWDDEGDYYSNDPDGEDFDPYDYTADIF